MHSEQGGTHGPETGAKDQADRLGLLTKMALIEIDQAIVERRLEAVSN